MILLPLDARPSNEIMTTNRYKRISWWWILLALLYIDKWIQKYTSKVRFEDHKHFFFFCFTLLCFALPLCWLVQLAPENSNAPNHLILFCLKESRVWYSYLPKQTWRIQIDRTRWSPVACDQSREADVLSTKAETETEGWWLMVSFRWWYCQKRVSFSSCILFTVSCSFTIDRGERMQRPSQPGPRSSPKSAGPRHWTRKYVKVKVEACHAKDTLAAFFQNESFARFSHDSFAWFQNQRVGSITFWPVLFEYILQPSFRCLTVCVWVSVSVCGFDWQWAEPTRLFYGSLIAVVSRLNWTLNENSITLGWHFFS